MFAVQSELYMEHDFEAADPLDAFDRSVGEVIGRLVPTTVLRSISGDKQWFDACCRRAYDAKQTACRDWC